jgi:AcrR family transcriptional regulator
METKKDEILQAACDLFFANGYDNTSIKAIAQAADVAPSHPYFYFQTKEDLLVAVLRKTLGESLEQIAEATKNCIYLEPEELSEKCFAAFGDMQKPARFIMASALTPKLAELVNSVVQEFIEPFAECFLPYFHEVSTNQANTAIELVFSLAVAYCLGGPEEPVKAAFIEILRIYGDENGDTVTVETDEPRPQRQIGKHVRTDTTDDPADDTTENSDDDSVEEIAEEIVEETAAETTEETAEMTTEETAEITAEDPAENSSEDPAENTAVIPTDELA